MWKLRACGVEKIEVKGSFGNSFLLWLGSSLIRKNTASSTRLVVKVNLMQKFLSSLVRILREKTDSKSNHVLSMDDCHRSSANIRGSYDCDHVISQNPRQIVPRLSLNFPIMMACKHRAPFVKAASF